MLPNFIHRQQLLGTPYGVVLAKVKNGYGCFPIIIIIIIIICFIFFCLMDQSKRLITQN
jgi:hypothetical protein